MSFHAMDLAVYVNYTYAFNGEITAKLCLNSDRLIGKTTKSIVLFNYSAAVL